MDVHATAQEVFVFASRNLDNSRRTHVVHKENFGQHIEEHEWLQTVGLGEKKIEFHLYGVEDTSHTRFMWHLISGFESLKKEAENRKCDYYVPSFASADAQIAKVHSLDEIELQYSNKEGSADNAVEFLKKYFQNYENRDVGRPAGRPANLHFFDSENILLYFLQCQDDICGSVAVATRNCLLKLSDKPSESGSIAVELTLHIASWLDMCAACGLRWRHEFSNLKKKLETVVVKVMLDMECTGQVTFGIEVCSISMAKELFQSRTDNRSTKHSSMVIKQMVVLPKVFQTPRGVLDRNSHHRSSSLPFTFEGYLDKKTGRSGVWFEIMGEQNQPEEVCMTCGEGRVEANVMYASRDKKKKRSTALAVTTKESTSTAAIGKRLARQARRSGNSFAANEVEGEHGGASAAETLMWD